MFCYGMSKMPNLNETKDIKNHKQIKDKTELLEMIGRAAALAHKNAEGLSLVEKIGLVMDKIFEPIGCQRVDPTE